MVRSLHQKPTFKRAYKKLQKTEREHVNQAIKTILSDPEIGNAKVGDLLGVRVCKFKVSTAKWLLAYELDGERIVLLAIGRHENSYRDLKRSR